MLQTMIAGGKSFVWLLLLCGFLLWQPSFLADAQTSTESRIVFVAFKNGQWDIFSISPSGHDLKQMTDDVFEDDHPAYSPDGTKLAYASRRDGNWDIYIRDLITGDTQRITNHLHYDGVPAWHPDGTSLAFESFRSGDLDVWQLDLARDDTPQNLTSTSTDGEFAPAWHANGNQLYFASWRSGNNDIWALDTSTQALEQITEMPTSERWPQWHVAGNWLVFSQNDLGDADIFALNTTSERSQQLTWLGSIEQVAFDPDGDAAAGIHRFYDGAQLVRLDVDNPAPQPLTDRVSMRNTISWHDQAVDAGLPITSLISDDVSSLYVEDMAPSSSTLGEPYDMVRINDLTVGSPWLSDLVDDSFQALRAQIRDEVGYDFLSELSEIYRPIDFYSEASLYPSWHKSGRAVDTLFDMPNGDMQIVRENIGGETYWRIVLRCVDQTGRCGRPLTANMWNYSGRARNVIAPEQGGIEQSNVSAYYVDFSEHAELYGWKRISSFDDEDFSWTWHFKAFEYWHYEKTFEDSQDDVNWYEAMMEVYPPQEVEDYFDWDAMRAVDEDPYRIAAKGIPLPPEAQQWWQALVALP